MTHSRSNQQTMEQTFTHLFFLEAKNNMVPGASLLQGHCSRQPSFATKAGSLLVCAQHQKYSQPEKIEDTN